MVFLHISTSCCVGHDFMNSAITSSSVRNRKNVGLDGIRTQNVNTNGNAVNNFYPA